MKHNAFTALSLAAALVVAGSAEATEFEFDFESYTVDDTMAAVTGWSQQTGDASAVFATNGTSKAGSKALSLDTGDEELIYQPDSTKDVSILTMDVCFVAADEAPAIPNNFKGQTMVYLDSSGNLNAVTNGAWGQVLTGLQEGWATLTMTFDYTGKTVTFKVGNSESAAVPLATTPATAFTKVTSVGFKGTGFIDNFVGDKAGIPAYVDNNVNATATYDNGSVSVTFSGYEGTIQYIEVEDSTGKKVYLRGDNATALINVSKLNGNIRSVKAHTQGSLATSCGVTPSASAVAVDTTTGNISITVPNAVSGLYYTPFGPDGKALANSKEILPEADGDPATLPPVSAAADWGVVKFQIVASDEKYTEGQSLQPNN
jgi:hypothetical protein